MHLHIDALDGDCTHRNIPCPFDLIGFRVDINGREGIILKCDMNTPLNTPLVYVKFADSIEWVQLWGAGIRLLRRVMKHKLSLGENALTTAPADLTELCGTLKYNELDIHLLNRCIHTALIPNFSLVRET